MSDGITLTHRGGQFWPGEIRQQAEYLSAVAGVLPKQAHDGAAGAEPVDR